MSANAQGEEGVSPGTAVGSSYRARTQRYILSAVGPIGVAGANFLLSFSMLRLERPEVFGTFAFLFAAALFMISISSALFGAPMQALQAGGGLAWSAVVGAVCSTALIASLVAGPLFAGIGTGRGLGPVGACCYGAFAMLTILRGVGRAWTYAEERPARVALSDASYAAVTLISFASAVGIAHVAPAAAVYPALALGTAVAIASLGRRFAALPWRPRRAALSRYAAIWRGQSRWSLLAVIATEAVANAHIYLLTLLAGAAAVAPVAASALLVRPINVIQNALVEFERPQMARFLSAGAMPEVERSIRLFRAVLLLAWGATVAIGAAIVLLQPGLVFPASYDLATVRLASTLWAAVSLVIVLQVPVNVLLQAIGSFRLLAQASLAAGAVSVGGVLLAIALGRPVWTIAAIVPGWLVSMVIVTRAARAVRAGPATAVA
jgi:O-antigen/teichoic acid export membrane protein